MKSLILAAAAVVALSFTTSTAKADHNHRSYYRSGCAPYYSTPYQAYRYSPSYSTRYYGYRSPSYGYGSPYHYHGYRGYSSSSIGVHGRNFSFHIGF